MGKIIFLQGCPASGKSTYAKQFIKDNPDYVRVNLDDIRAMLAQSWCRSIENISQWIQIETIRSAFNANHNVICDNTNLNKKSIDRIINLTMPEEIEYKTFFDTPLDICIERDSQREKPVGADIVTKFYNMYDKWNK